MNDAFHPLVAIGLLAAVLTGCGSSEAEKADVEPQDRVEQSPVVVTSIVDRAGYDAVLVSLQGKVVLVDCWASWCVPCLQQLPHTLEKAGSHDELAVVTLCFDDPGKQQQIARTLAFKGGTDQATHLISQHGGSSQSMEEFEVPGGALPHFKLYDREGKLHQTFGLDPTAEKQFTVSDIDAAVQELLGDL